MQKRKGDERIFEFPQRNRPSDKPSQAWNHLVVQNFKTYHILNSPHHRSVTNTYLFKCRFCVVNVVRFQKHLFLGPRGPLVLPLVGSSVRPSALKSGSLIYRHTCLMNHQKSHQTNPTVSGSPLSCPLSCPLSWSPWDHESESRINSQTFLGQFVLVSEHLETG